MASRRAAERMIAEGRVRVNGVPAQIGQSVDPDRDRVEVDGRPVEGADRRFYILLNKPAGVVTTARDTHGRRTVVDYVRSLEARVFPVGRLDIDVEGALLLTNDGELAHRITHPRYEVEKVYDAWVVGRMKPEALRQLEQGVMLDDGMTAPARAEVVETGPNSTRLRLTLHEGRNREVKRMCAAVGHRVRTLKRIAVGGVELGELPRGQWRHLEAQEVAALRRRTGLDAP